MASFSPCPFLSAPNEAQEPKFVTWLFHRLCAKDIPTLYLVMVTIGGAISPKSARGACLPHRLCANGIPILYLVMVTIWGVISPKLAQVQKLKFVMWLFHRLCAKDTPTLYLTAAPEGHLQGFLGMAASGTGFFFPTGCYLQRMGDQATSGAPIGL